MHKFTSEWKCDVCPKEVKARDQSRPKGWMRLDLVLNHGNPPMFEFDTCSPDCMRSWLKAHGFEVKE